MRNIHFVSIAIAGSLLALVSTAAHAATKRVHVYVPGASGSAWAGQATFDDAADKVCALLGRNEQHDKVVVRLLPTDTTGPTLRVVDSAPLPAGQSVCSSAADIPENTDYRMRVTVRDLDGDAYRVASSFRT